MKMSSSKKEQLKKTKNAISAHNDQLGENASTEFAEDYDNKIPAKIEKPK